MDRGRERCSDFLPGAVPLSAPQRGWKGNTETQTAAADQQSWPTSVLLSDLLVQVSSLRARRRGAGQERGASSQPRRLGCAAHSVVPLPVSSLQSSHSSSNTPQGHPRLGARDGSQTAGRGCGRKEQLCQGESHYEEGALRPGGKWARVQ